MPEQQNVQQPELPCNVIVRSQQKPLAVPHTYGGNYLSLLPSAPHISNCGRACVFQRLFSLFAEFVDYEKARIDLWTFVGFFPRCECLCWDMELKKLDVGLKIIEGEVESQQK